MIGDTPPFPVVAEVGLGAACLHFSETERERSEGQTTQCYRSVTSLNALC